MVCEPCWPPSLSLSRSLSLSLSLSLSACISKQGGSRRVGMRTLGFSGLGLAVQPLSSLGWYLEDQGT